MIQSPNLSTISFLQGRHARVYLKNPIIILIKNSLAIKEIKNKTISCAWKM